MKQARIREVRAFVIAPGEMGADYHNQHGSHWIIDLPIANPMSVYEEYKASGAKILRPPQNYPWAFEMHVEDPDGHVLRFGSEPRTDRPFVAGF